MRGAEAPLGQPLLAGTGGAGNGSAGGAGEARGAVLGTLLVTVLAGLSAALRLLLPERDRLAPEQAAKLARLRERAGVPFDAGDPDHREALRALWRAAFPGDEPPEDLRTPQWKEMGWQGVDPATDFRAGGFLALENLLFLANRHPAVFRELRDKKRGNRSEWEYPFAIAGVNVTFALSEMLGVGGGGGGGCRREGAQRAAGGRVRKWSERLGGLVRGSRGEGPRLGAEARAFTHLLAHPDADDTLFDEVYCAAFQLLDRIWLREGATYMEFNGVMGQMKAELRQVLLEGGSTDPVTGLMDRALSFDGAPREDAGDSGQDGGYEPPIPVL